MSAQLTNLEEKMAAHNFWDDQNEARSIIDKARVLRLWVEPWKKLDQACIDVQGLIELLEEEGSDLSLLEELRNELSHIEEDLHKFEFKKMLCGEHDNSNAIMTIHSGAGGTEACDWVAMLYRMYSRWIESQGFKLTVTDILPGEEAGIKSITYLVEGDYAFGYLQAEKGVHRLVRLSPFDANKRRHTSFASVDVIPEVDDEIVIDIDEKELRIDTYRSSGAGGQHVNVTDSAVRITHIPTGIVVQCQNERSQHKNKSFAMKILKSRLFELHEKEQEKKLQTEYGQKDDIAWGSQIRSYVMHPYSMVKDHRTSVETSNVSAVMDGQIDKFIEEFLKMRKIK
ncbi:peptide chain release factor 2 [bacterium]|nr:peptide chain release factor 2 [bacterium]